MTTAESGENYYCEECCETALSTSAYRELSELLEDGANEPTEPGPERPSESDRATNEYQTDTH